MGEVFARLFAPPPEPQPPACVFTSHELREVCELSKRGIVPALSAYIEQILSQRCCRIGPRTFCPDEDSPSAFVVAVQNGRLEVLRYLLSCQPEDFIVDHLANTSFYYRGQRHVCSPLYAACRCGYLDIAEELIAAGAAIDLPCKCCMETPLCAAASRGFLDVVRLLLSHGANLKKVDKKAQWTPLFTAAANGHVAVVREFLQLGADGYQLVPPGHYVSALQVAALSGYLNEAMVDAFVCLGLSPIKSLSSHNEHTPSPLYIAAALGYRDIVTTLLTHPDCSPDIRLDAIKILGPPWLDSESVPGLESPSTSFGLSSTSSLNIIDVYAVTQSLQEYMYFGGYADRALLDLLFKSGKLSFESERYGDAETFWIRGMELASSAKFSTPVLQFLRFTSYSHVCTVVYDMLAANYTPLFSRYIDFFLSWSDLHRRACHDVHMVVDAVLVLIASWLHHDVVLQREESRSDYDGYIGSEECERYGQLIVQRYLHVLAHATGTVMEEVDEVPSLCKVDPFDGSSSILWYTISLVQKLKIGYMRQRALQFEVLSSNQPVFFDALLRWGADTVINEPKDGETPLHVLATKLPALIPTFLAHGAHIDVVDRVGQTPYEQAAVLPEAKAQLAPTGPLPLVCLACRAIVQHKIPYQTAATSLPPRMINIIKLHDPY